MKKLVIFALSILSLLAIIATPVAAQTSLADVTLWADNMNINAGNVTITGEGGVLTVTFNAIDGWVMGETHLFLGITTPVKSSPGRFPFKHEELGGVTSDTFTVSLADFGAAAGNTIYVAAQAALEKPLLDEAGVPVLDEFGNPVILEESAWAEGSPIPPGKNWAMFFSVVIPAAEEPPIAP